MVSEAKQKPGELPFRSFQDSPCKKNIKDSVRFKEAKTSIIKQRLTPSLKKRVSFCLFLINNYKLENMVNFI